MKKKILLIGVCVFAIAGVFLISGPSDKFGSLPFCQQSLKEQTSKENVDIYKVNIVKTTRHSTGENCVYEAVINDPLANTPPAIKLRILETNMDNPSSDGGPINCKSVGDKFILVIKGNVSSDMQLNCSRSSIHDSSQEKEIRALINK